MTWRLLCDFFGVDCPALTLSAQPVITELQPRGATEGQALHADAPPQDLGEGVKILSTMPASFTLLTPDQPPLTPGGPMQARVATQRSWSSRPRILASASIRSASSPRGHFECPVVHRPARFLNSPRTNPRFGGLPNTQRQHWRTRTAAAPRFTLNGTRAGLSATCFALSAKAGGSA